jgi:hypothetical protein
MKENEDFLPIILKTSSLSLFSSVSLFVLIDAGKNDAFGGGACWHWHPRQPYPRAKAGCRSDIGQGINAAVHNTASPETFRDWLC